VLGGAFVDGGAARAHRGGHLVKEFGFAERLAGYDDGPLEAAALQFLAEGIDFARAEDDLFEFREKEFANWCAHLESSIPVTEPSASFPKEESL
jgi:hypothetical protein